MLYLGSRNRNDTNPDGIFGGQPEGIAMYRHFRSSTQGILIQAGLCLLVFFALTIRATNGMGYNGDSRTSDPAKLLISEISTLGTDQEYIEIFNPGAENVDLSDYYLTDAIYSPADQYYYNIGLGNPTQATVGGGAFFDFHARFPDGFTIAAGDTIVITIPGSSQFFDNFGFNPDLELFEDGGAADEVPDMRWIFGTVGENSIIGEGSVPTLTNAAETVILYHHVIGQDNVVDIDVFAWKDPSYSSTSYFFNKSGVIIGSHFYLPEIGTNPAFAFGSQNQFGNSYHRTDATEGDQTPTGSNGVGGRDETSEDFNTTFAMMPYDPSVPGNASDVPNEFTPGHPALLGNIPNPFNPQTTIAFEIPEQQTVTLRVFDMAGRLVKNLITTELHAPGRHEVVWNGRDESGRQAASGTYFYRLEAGDSSRRRGWF